MPGRFRVATTLTGWDEIPAKAILSTLGFAANDLRTKSGGESAHGFVGGDVNLDHGADDGKHQLIGNIQQHDRSWFSQKTATTIFSRGPLVVSRFRKSPGSLFGNFPKFAQTTGQKLTKWPQPRITAVRVETAGKHLEAATREASAGPGNGPGTTKNWLPQST